MIVKEEPDAHHPGRADADIMGQHEAQRPDDMRRYGLEPLALHEGFTDQAELVKLEIAQAAMDELRRCRRSRAREIGLLDEHDGQSAPHGVARDAATIDAAADDEHIHGPSFDHERAILPSPLCGEVHSLTELRLCETKIESKQ